MSDYNVAVVGAGAVGVEMVRVLRQRGFPVRELRVLARSDREMEIDGVTHKVRETTPEAFDGIQIALFAGTEGEKGAAVTFAAEATKRGAVVIDNGNDFRMDPKVPLVVPEVNGEDVTRHQGIIANPNCSTIQMVVSLKPLHDAARVRRVIVSTYQAVSGAGGGAIRELAAETEARVTDAMKRAKAPAAGIRVNMNVTDAMMKAKAEAAGIRFVDLSTFQIDPSAINIVPGHLALRHNVCPLVKDAQTLTVATANPQDVFAMDDLRLASGLKVKPVLASLHAIQEALRKHYAGGGAGAARPNSQAFAKPIAFNALAHIGGFRADGFTSEEWKMVAETHKILHDDTIAINATCVRIPVYNGHSESIYVETERKLMAEEARALWGTSPGIQVIDAPDPSDGDPNRRSYPTPQDADGADVTLIGRVREDPFIANGLSFWCIADNLRKGAALNAVQIAEELIRRNAIA